MKVKKGTTVTCSCGRSYVYDRKQGHKTDTCNSCNVNKRRNETKRKMVVYKGGKCQICGYNKTMRSLVFHHRDPSKKEFGVNATIAALKWERIKTELDKCDLLCANCHGEVHEELEMVRVVGNAPT